MTSTEMYVRAYAVRDEMNFARQILLDPELSGAAKQVAGAILTFINWRTGTAWPSLETIAARASVSVASVKRALGQLTRYITVSAGGGRGRSNVYSLKIEAEIQRTAAPDYRETSSSRQRKTRSAVNHEPFQDKQEPSLITKDINPSTTGKPAAAQPQANAGSGGGEQIDGFEGNGEAINRLAGIVTKSWHMSRDRVVCMLAPLVELHGHQRIYRALGQLLTAKVNRDDLPVRLGAALGAVRPDKPVNQSSVPLVSTTPTPQEKREAEHHRQVLTDLSRLSTEKKTLIRRAVLAKLLSEDDQFNPSLLASDIILANKMIATGVEID